MGSSSLPTIEILARVPLIARLSGPNQNRLAIQTILTPVNLEECRKSIYKALTTFLYQIGPKLKVDEYRAFQALRDLHRLGRALNQRIFGAQHYNTVSNFLKREFPLWTRCDGSGYQPTVLRMINAEGHSLPLEFFPLFDFAAPSNFNGSTELFSLAASFPAMSTIVSRVISGTRTDASDTMLENGGKLRLRFFQHAGVQAAKLGFKHLTDKVNGCEVLGPWPERSLTHADFVSELASHLWERGTAPKSSLSMQDHVQHFACHCHTECADSMQYSLRMAHRGSRLWLSYDQRVTIQELLGEISGFPQRLGRPTAGLVFLNACGSSKMTPIGVASFPSLFLFNLENEAVVGTETPIPDEFATEFATEFYRQFVQGVSMGEALHRARWTMLKVHKNPLGILYTAYGNPGLRVRKPIL